MKAPLREISSLRGRIPILVRHELYQHPAAPVIRTAIRLYDQPTCPLALETFTNVADPQQQSDFAALATQKDLYLLFYDEQLRHRLSKSVGKLDTETIAQTLAQADRLLAAIPKDEFDFDQAKAVVMRQTTL